MFRFKKKQSDNHLIQIFDAGVVEVKPQTFIGQNIKFKDNKILIENDEIDLKRFKRIFLIGSGKASVSMAKAMTAIYPGKFDDNLLICNTIGSRFTRLKIKEGGHPYPNKHSFSSGKAMVEFVRKIEMNDFFIYVLSGGSSALMEMTYGGLNDKEFASVTEILQKAGLSIFELNTLRKKLSKIKNGNLGKMAQGHGIVLVLSDVLGNDLATIGSAPFYPLEIDNERIKQIIVKYKLIDLLPKKVVQELFKVHPKQTHNSYRHYILSDNRHAIRAAVRFAKTLKYKTYIIDDALQGEAREIGKQIASTAKKHLSSGEATCLIYGGETTVKVEGDGKGGRNQELVLSAMIELINEDRISFLSGGTDGIDGPTNAAGAFFDAAVLQKVRTSTLDPKAFLDNNDSYTYFKKMDALLNTGFTGTNVGDIVVVLVNPLANSNT